LRQRVRRGTLVQQRSVRPLRHRPELRAELRKLRAQGPAMQGGTAAWTGWAAASARARAPAACARRARRQR
jgi:hypothetical protein